MVRARCNDSCNRDPVLEFSSLTELIQMHAIAFANGSMLLSHAMRLPRTPHFCWSDFLVAQLEKLAGIVLKEQDAGIFIAPFVFCTWQ